MLPSASSPAASRLLTWHAFFSPRSARIGTQGTELYTAAEMRDHCMRQIARYTRVIQVIDTHPHLFPGAAAAEAPPPPSGGEDAEPEAAPAAGGA